MTTYKPITNQLQTTGLLIRIRRASGGAWLPCPLLAVSAGWVQVDDGGPMWVMLDQVNRLDWGILATFERLREARN